MTLPVQPSFREKQWILEQARGCPGSVTLVRVGRKHVAVVPLDVDATLMLQAYRHSEADMVLENRRIKGDVVRTVVIKDGSDPLYTTASALRPELIRACIPIDSKKENDSRLYFPFANLFGEDPYQTFLFRHLERSGFHVILSRTLAKWIRKEWRREQKELAPYDLPEIKDRRPLFDQMEEGIMLVCHTDVGEFTHTEKYVVTSLKDQNGSETGIVLQKFLGEALHGDKLTWYNNHLMENHFTMEAGTETVYDPTKSLVALYPKEHAQNMDRLKAMNLDLWDHSVYDAAQGAMKRNVMDCKPQRMGKSAEAIAICLLWGSKRVAFVSPSKDTRQEVKKELERLNLKDYILVDSFEDLERGRAENKRWFLMDSYFVKGLETDSAPRGNDKFEADAAKYGSGEMIARCPYCDATLQRWEYDPVSADFGRWHREIKFGYACFNKDCSFQWEAPKVRRVSPGRYRGRKLGAAWWNPEEKTRSIATTVQTFQVQEDEQVVRGPGTGRSGSGYVDLERAKIAKYYVELKGRSSSGEVKDDHPKLQFKGRMHLPVRIDRRGAVALNASKEFYHPGFVKQAWSPARYKRFKKFFSVVIVDEAHMLASGFKSDQARSVMGLQAKHHITLTGTPMPNAPSDPYWQCHWAFGGGNKLFPYSRGAGFTKYWKTFCKNVEVTNSEGVTRKKKLPIATAPLKQRKLHAPLIIRRTFSDPMVVDSLLAKGFHYPTLHYHTLHATPDPYQAALLVSAMDRFEESYETYTQQMQEEQHEINTAYVLSSMSLMKVAATCPDFLNMKLKLANPDSPDIYLGVPGGGKTREIRRIVAQKKAKGEKVLILSFYKHELSILMDCLAEFNPTLYDIDNWDAEQRFECRQRFLNDPDCGLLIGSINALQVGVDLSSADTAICADLLWSPGRQDQAVARILKPLKLRRDCEIYYTILEHSLDEHIFNTFYAKRVASEQVMDGVISTPRPTDFSIKAFVDQVLAERSSMMRYTLDVHTEPINYIPMLNNLATLGDRE